MLSRVILIPRLMAILQRAKHNPILMPDVSNWWESKAVFNCGIISDKNTIHMLYRAIGEYEYYVSRIGYASSSDGISFERRKCMAIYPQEDYERYGLEDPRLMRIGNDVYVTYVVLSNYVKERPSASTALAKTNDFFHYKRAGIITIPDSDDKDTVLFPKENGDEKNSEFRILHRPSKWVGPKYNTDKPSIWMSESHSLTNYRKHTLLIKPEQSWESLKIGVGIPPIKTRQGWLVIYHGVSMDRVYSAGALLLDVHEPTKILGRTKEPILRPEESYEKTGDVGNVVFPTGACILDGKLFVYYGGADKVCCVATTDLGTFLDHILSQSI
jgi:beta-1,2-mannobiose phosphorylase / 1,2-beta-oligomannan phosphorylase